LETGVRDVVSHVVRQNNITFVFQSPLNPSNKEMGDHQSLHGDGVKDIAFTVDDARGLWKNCVLRGGKSIREPWEERDENGVVIMATIGTYGDTVHTFVERKNYHGDFLPNFIRLPFKDPLEKTLPPTNLINLDHVVGNQPDLEMNQICEMCVIYFSLFFFCFCFCFCFFSPH
jgi:4-hydroxyphenylpyruvate dioxygenase